MLDIFVCLHETLLYDFFQRLRIVYGMGSRVQSFGMLVHIHMSHQDSLTSYKLKMVTKNFVIISSMFNELVKYCFQNVQVLSGPKCNAAMEA